MAYLLKNLPVIPETQFQSLGQEGPIEKGTAEIQPVSPKGDQAWVFTGKTDAETPILWPPDWKS